MRRSKTKKLKAHVAAQPSARRGGGSLDEGKRVLAIEARAIQSLIDRLDGGFAKAVDLLFTCKGKVVVSGMGKSGLIGQKIAATMASTGTASARLIRARNRIAIVTFPSTFVTVVCTSVRSRLDTLG